MSKNNQQEMQKKMASQRQRFTLRKLSVGVASVLLGTTFLVGGTVAHADDVQNSSDDQQLANDNSLNQQTVTLKSQANSTVETKATAQTEQPAAENNHQAVSTSQKQDTANPTTTTENHQATANSQQTTGQDTPSADQGTILYGQISDRSKNPAGFNTTGINPATGKKYPVQMSDLEHDFIFKRTIVMHNGDLVSTFEEGLDGKKYDQKTDTKSGMYYRNAVLKADGTLDHFTQWKRLGNNGIYEFVDDLVFPKYELPTAMRTNNGVVETAVPSGKAEDDENTTVNLYWQKVTVNVTYKDSTGQTVTNGVSSPFIQLPDKTYQYEGSDANLIKDKDKIASDLLTLTSSTDGIPQFSSLAIDGNNYVGQSNAKSALMLALSDSKNHNIQININFQYQLKINLYDETSGKLITIPATDANAKWFKTENGHSVYSFPVSPNGYVVDLTKLYNYTMTDASLQTWKANFEKHSNGYWYTKSDLDKPITLTLNYRSNGTYSFMGTMRDTDGNVLPTDYTKSLGNMYKNGAYQYAQIKPGAYINDLTKFKLDASHQYDYYLTADSLAQWKKYFEQHANGFWYAKSDLDTNVALNLTYDKVQKRNIKLTLVDAKTGKAITNYAEKTTALAKAFDAHMSGNVYTDYNSEVGFASYLLHMPYYELTAASKAKLEAFLAQPYVEADFIGELDYQQLAPIHVVAKDSDGNELFEYDITTQNAQAGNPYEIRALNLPGYKLVKSENATGEVSTTKPTATFIYAQDPTSTEGTWIKDYKILTPGKTLPDQVGTIGVPNNKYNISFDDAEAENIKYYQEHGYTYLGAANAFKLGQTWYPLSWLKPTLVPNQGVTIHYYGINSDQSETKLHDSDYLAENPNNPDQNNRGIDEDQFYYPEGSFTATPRDFDGWTLIGMRDAKGNFTKLNYDGSNLVLAAGANSAPLGQIKGEYLPFAQDITYVYAHVPVKQTEDKVAKRTIHFVGDEGKGTAIPNMPELQNSREQTVTLEGTYYVSPENGTRVAVKTIQVGGENIVVIDDAGQPTEKWTVKSMNGVVAGQNNKYDFSAVNDPATINVNADWSASHANVPTGNWYHTSGNAELATVENNDDWLVLGTDGQGTMVLPDQYLVYKQPATPHNDTPHNDTPHPTPSTPGVPSTPNSQTPATPAASTINGETPGAVKLDSTSSAKNLPQTGSQQSKLGLVGLSLAALAGAIGFGLGKTRKRNED